LLCRGLFVHRPLLRFFSGCFSKAFLASLRADSAFVRSAGRFFLGGLSGGLPIYAHLGFDEGFVE
jgi:hypothetical protein